MSTPPNAAEPNSASPQPAAAAPEQRPRFDRRYLTGCVAGLLLGGALGVPGAYALLRAEGARPCIEGPSREQLDAMHAAGLQALAQKDAARALEIFRKMEKARPGDAFVHNNICVALNDLGRYSEAVQSCKDALDLMPSYALAKSNLAWARSQRDRAAASGARAAPAQ